VSREPIEDDPMLQACALTFISDLGLVSGLVIRISGIATTPSASATAMPAAWAFGSIHDHAGALVASVAQAANINV
jgi:acyl-CoA thioesterase